MQTNVAQQRLNKTAAIETGEFMTVNEQKIAVDHQGYLINPDDWNEDVAKEMAVLCKVEMTSDHWYVVNFIRKEYEYSSCVPEARHALKAMKVDLGKDRATRKYLYKLFPYGYAIQSCRIAGTRMPLKIMLDL